MNPNETIINASRDFLALNSTSHLVRWVMIVFLLFCGIPQKTVAAITNYTERQVRNIRVRFENGDFLGEGKKRGLGRTVKYITHHVPHSKMWHSISRNKLEVSVKTIERELEEYASQTCTGRSGRRKSNRFT